MVHDNEHIRGEYNALRIQLANLLRDIEELRKMDLDDRNVIELDSYRVEIDEESSVINGGVDALIRDGKITPQMGTSLMNDYSYARDAIWQLTDVAKTLFGSRDVADMEAEELIGLDEDDVEERAAGR
jgi:phosphate:Na+ symporter